MSQLTESQSKIQQLQAQIQELRQNAVAELEEKKAALTRDLKEVDAQLFQLTGKSLEQKKRRTRADLIGRTPTLAELKDLLSVIPGKTLNLRKEGIDAKHIKALAKENPEVLQMGGKGAWPEVTLLK